MTVVDRIRAIIESPLADSQTEVVDIEHGHGLLRITIDRPGGVDLNVVTEVTEVINELLDAADPIGDAYTLEVSSPGLERPLRIPAHFKRFVGTMINVKTKIAREGQRRFEGRLIAANENEFELDGQIFSYDDVERARTIFEWNDGASKKGDEKSSKPSKQKSQPKGKAS